MTSFSSLGLSEAMLNNLEDLQYRETTEIQAASIPPILAGKDVLAQAKTGSGKTAAFGIGLIENLKVSLYRIQALVLCPTRELATQVCEELRRIARCQHNIKLVTVTGGVPVSRQEHSLKHQAHMVVGTPGRVLKLLQRGSLNLDNIRTVVLDEADRMLEMGFIEQIEEIFRYAPRQRQTLCFSATFPAQVKGLSRSLQNNPEEIAVEIQHEDNVIVQHFYSARDKDRIRITREILIAHRPNSTLIFCNTKDECRRVHSELRKAGIYCLSLHGDLEQKERTEVLVRFSNSSCTVLVATDVAARGLDIDELGAVINFDVPFEADTYVHRVGRTGRAGAKGLAFSLVVSGDERRLEAISERMEADCSAEIASFDNEAQDGFPRPPMVTLSINGGRRNKVSAGDILGALTSKDGIPGSDVGKIDRMDHLTFVAVRRSSAQRALAVLQNSPIKGRRFLAKLND